MAKCMVCNWTPHDAAVHTDLCRNGHSRAIVGTYKTAEGRRCRACQRAACKRYRDLNTEQERERRRQWGRMRSSPPGGPSKAAEGGRPVAGSSAADRKKSAA